MSEMVETVTELRRMHELDKIARSGRGISPVENVERAEYHAKYGRQDLIDTLLDICDRLIHVSTQGDSGIKESR